MAETRRVTSSSASPRPKPKPRPRHPPSRYNPPLRPTVEETHDLRPPGAEERPRPVRPTPARPPAVPQAVPIPPPRREALRRSTAEWVILAVLLFGLGLNAVVLLTNSRLSRSDLVLGGTVLLAGLILLALMELCRRSAPPPAE